MKAFLGAVLLTSTVFAQTPQTPTKTVPQQGAPPKNLTVRPDGHVSANEDPANSDKFEVHVVKPGETLSRIAGEALKNPRVWPQLWEQNEHIINPHWIYPNDKILIRPVTTLSEAKPPEVAATPPEVTPSVPSTTPPNAASAANALPGPTDAASAANKSTNSLLLAERKPVPEVKFEDLYCSGFARTSAVSNDLKIISKFDATGAVLAAEADYVYLSQGSEDGIRVGSTYQVVRPTKTLTDPNGRTKATRDLGMYYMDIGQMRVVLAQPDFSLARVIHSCSDAVEVGDILVPFEQVRIPLPERARSFGPMMTTTSGIKGRIVASKDVLLNFSSSFKLSGIIPGVHGTGTLSSIERGIAAEGAIVYINIGTDKTVKPGDVFIVYRDNELDRRLYDFPKEAKKLKGTRTAIGELVVLKVGERASTALVTYASDALLQGDSVERK